MPTKAELKQQEKHVKVKIRKGDRVVIIAGKDKGQIGFVLAVSPKEQKVLLYQENKDNPDERIALNAVVKHRKARNNQERSARIKQPAPLHISNIMLLDPKTNEATRVGRRKEGGKLVRYSKKSGDTIIDAPIKED